MQLPGCFEAVFEFAGVRSISDCAQQMGDDLTDPCRTRTPKGNLDDEFRGQLNDTQAGDNPRFEASPTAWLYSRRPHADRSAPLQASNLVATNAAMKNHSADLGVSQGGLDGQAFLRSRRRRLEINRMPP